MYVAARALAGPSSAPVAPHACYQSSERERRVPGERRIGRNGVELANFAPARYPPLATFGRRGWGAVSGRRAVGNVRRTGLGSGASNRFPVGGRFARDWRGGPVFCGICGNLGLPRAKRRRQTVLPFRSSARIVILLLDAWPRHAGACRPAGPRWSEQGGIGPSERRGFTWVEIPFVAGKGNAMNRAMAGCAAAQLARQAKNAARTGVEATARGLMRRQGHGGGRAGRVGLGGRPGRAPADADRSRLARVRRARPLTRRGARFVFDRLPSAKRFRRVRGKPAHYVLRWVNRTGEKGPWSETATATIGV